MATDQIKALSAETSRLEDEISDKLSKLHNLLIKQRDLITSQISIVEERNRFIIQEVLQESKKQINDKEEFRKQTSVTIATK